ncbi:MAG: hypothetical protein ABI977_22080 [Acidobacteriota bacterium]
MSIASMMQGMTSLFEEPVGIPATLYPGTGARFNIDSGAVELPDDARPIDCWGVWAIENDGKTGKVGIAAGDGDLSEAKSKSRVFVISSKALFVPGAEDVPDFQAVPEVGDTLVIGTDRYSVEDVGRASVGETTITYRLTLEQA